MDPFSHAVLGAALTHGCFHKRLGLKGAAWGAAAAMLPDIDIFFSIGADDFEVLVRHRGITHALIFAPIVGPVWGYLLARHYARGGGTPRTWTWIGAVTLALWSHPLLDYVTPYGTQLLQPFSDARLARGAMPIIDPLFTLILSIGVVLAWRWSPAPRAHYASIAAVVVSTACIGYADHLNRTAEDAARRQLAAAGITDADVSSYPTLLQIFHRRIVARTPAEDRVGFFDTRRPCPIAWGIAPRAQPDLLARLEATREGQIFNWFTLGMMHVSVDSTDGGDNVSASDLRYGANNDPNESIFAMTAQFDLAEHLQHAAIVPYRPDVARVRFADVIGAGSSCLP